MNRLVFCAQSFANFHGVWLYLQVQKTLASVKLDKLPDRGENLKRRQQALQEELHDANIGSAGESNERATDSQGAEALADQIGSMKL